MIVAGFGLVLGMLDDFLSCWWVCFVGGVAGCSLWSYFLVDVLHFRFIALFGVTCLWLPLLAFWGTLCANCVWVVFRFLWTLSRRELRSGFVIF